MRFTIPRPSYKGFPLPHHLYGKGRASFYIACTACVNTLILHTLTSQMQITRNRYRTCENRELFSGNGHFFLKPIIDQPSGQYP